MREERRRHRRYRLQLPIRLTVDGRAMEQSKAIDISSGGLGIVTVEQLELGLEAEIRFAFRGSECGATGQLVRTMPYGQVSAAAINFENANRELRQFLGELEQTPDVMRPAYLCDIRDVAVALVDTAIAHRPTLKPSR